MDRGRLARSTASRVTWIALPTVTYATHNPPSRLYVYEWCVAWRCRGKRGPGYAEATTRRREPGNILLCRHPHFPHADTGWCSVRNDNVPEHHQVLDSANLPHYRHPLQASMGSKMSTMSQFCGEAGFSESSRLIFPHLPNPTANKKHNFYGGLIIGIMWYFETSGSLCQSPEWNYVKCLCAG